MFGRVLDVCIFNIRPVMLKDDVLYCQHILKRRCHLLGKLVQNNYLFIIKSTHK